MTKPAVYKNPTPGQPLISTIASDWQTPILEVKYCNLVKPFYYKNSPNIPRYSITCFADPLEHKDFLKNIQNIEKNENVESIIKNDSEKKDGKLVMTGKVIIKFQSKDIIPVYIRNEEDKESNSSQLELEDELAVGEKVMVIYDILRYTKKNTMATEHGISFKPSCIYYYPSRNKNEDFF